MENSEKPLIAWEFISSDWKTKYLAWIYDRHEECNCKGFIRHKKCKHVEELKIKLKNNAKTN